MCVLLLANTPSDPLAAREAAYRANNRGVALLEQYKADEAAKAFREALSLDPKNPLARVNLSIALLNVPDTAGAETAAKAALEVAPESPQAWYVRGVAARAENRTADAQAAFRKVLAIDATDVGSRVNLGQLALLVRDYETAVTEFRAAIEAEPYNGSALYNLGIALVRSGKQEEGQKILEKFQSLKNEGAATMIGQTYPEQGRYAEAVVPTGTEPGLVDPKTPDVKFVDATKQFGLPSATAKDRFGGFLIFDWNADGSLDLLATAADDAKLPKGNEPLAAHGTLALYENNRGRFVDVTEKSGLPRTVPAFGAVAADVDNDGAADLLLMTGQGPRLFHRDASRYVDITTTSGVAGPPNSAAAFADLDHDGDADLILGRDVNGGSIRVLRNDGRGRFSDVTKAVLGPEAPAASTVIPTDYDNRRDMDMLFVDRRVSRLDAPDVALYRNMRDGTFRNVAKDVGLAEARATHLAAGDVNKDGLTDLFLAVEGRPRFAVSDGKGRYRIVPAPDETAAAEQAQLLDYDNDGLLDLVIAAREGFRLFRNVGASWVNATTSAMPSTGGGQVFASGDLDNDGDTDIVWVSSNGDPHVLRNEGGNKNHSLKVQLHGLVSNRSGIGAKVEVRAGSLYQKIETSSTFPPTRPADLIFGLGQRSEADAVRVIWPSGTMQAETPEAKATTMKIVELDRKPSSCPYLYAWNGERFEFITDFMGGGEMGYRHENGVLNMPDPVEYVRLTDEQLRAKDGRYELRVTNELEEMLFVDRLRLGVVDHPAGVEIHPNEGMISTPASHRLIAVKEPRAPRAASDEQGRDILGLVAALDDRSPAGFGLTPIRGYAAEHTLTLDLGGGPADVLLLTGWTDYAFSSDNVAAGQAGMTMRVPSLEMRDRTGAWKTVIAEVGIPVGRPQTIAVDLSGRWLSESREARIVTNMRIYWDQVRVGAAADGSALRPQWIEPSVADLRDRGFSAELIKEPPQRTISDYTRVSADLPWKTFPGRYTRLGDARKLLAQTDDVFVLSKPGDELALSFDAASIPPPRPGFHRTFLLFADGYSKEMDINSATPDSGMPWPFHAMTRYPYGSEQRFPMTPEKQRLYDEYTTRLVRREIAPLLTASGAEARTPIQ